MIDNSQFPYGFTDEHFHPPDENGNRFFNDAGKLHAQNNLPTQPTIGQQIASTNFAPMQSIQGSPMLSPILQQGMTTQQNGQPISAQQAGTIADAVGMTGVGGLLGGTATTGLGGLIGALI